MNEADNFIQLSELNEQIKDVLLDHFPESIWLTAEIFSMNVNKAGHCYLELAEKSGKSQKIIAKSRAVIWAYQYNLIKTYFEQTTGQEFSSGIKVLIKAMPQFHELYGYSLIINDINPNFTLGDLALQRQKIIEKLKETGVFDLNKEQYLSLIPQRLAIISSSSAAGYGDFMNQIEKNPYHYSFKTELFEAIMQGNTCADSIMSVLEEIYDREEDFDAVILIRGGGSKSDLSCFDEYELAFHICHFPIPVITGIGHERDESIADLVAFKALKTPTAVAEFLIEKFSIQESLLQTYSEQIERIVKTSLINAKNRLSGINNSIFKVVYDRIGLEKSKISRSETSLRKEIVKFNVTQNFYLTNSKKRISTSVESLFLNKNKYINDAASVLKKDAIQLIKEKINTLNIIEKQVKLQNPHELLKKGYSITLINGKVVKSIKDIDSDEELVTILFDGEIRSKVE